MAMSRKRRRALRELRKQGKWPRARERDNLRHTQVRKMADGSIFTECTDAHRYASRPNLYFFRR